MADTTANFGGNTAGLAAACAAAQAMIDAVHGGTRELELKVTGGNAATGEMQKFGQSVDAATAAHERHVDAMDRSASSARGFSDSTDRASRAMGGSANDSARAAAGIRDVGRETERTTQASQGMFSQMRQGFWAGADKELQKLAAAHEEAGTEMDRTGIRGAFMARVAKNVADGAEGAAGGVGLLTRGMSSLTAAGDQLTGNLGSVAGPLMTIGTGALYATAGAAALTAGVGALGAGSVVGLGLMGGALGAGASALTSFTADILTGTKSKPGPLYAQFTDLANKAQGFEQEAVRPYGDALLRMGAEGVRAAPGIVAPLKDAFTEIGQVAEAGTPNMIKSVHALADAFGEVTHDTAPAFGAFFQNLPALTSAAIDPVEHIAKTFGNLSVGTEALPAFARMTGAVGDFGSELLRIGADNLTPFQDDVTSMVDHVSGAAHNLSPAIKPAMGAVTSLVNDVADGLGSPEVTAGVKQFSDTVTRNAPSITTGLKNVATAALWVGAATVDVASGVASMTSGGSFDAPVMAALADRGAGKAQKPVGNEGSPSAAGNVDSFTLGQADLFTGKGQGGQRPPGFPGPTQGPSTVPTFPGEVGSFGQVHPGGPATPASQSPRSQLAFEAGIDPSQIPQRGGGGASPLAPQFTGGGGGAAGGSALPQMLQSLGPAAAQSMQQVQSAMQGGAQVFQPLQQSVTQASQSIQTQLPQATQQATQGMTQSVQQAPAAPAMQTLMQHMTNTIDQAAPQMASGGASLGAAITGGMEQGITKTIIVVDTIIRKHVNNVIDVAADALDAHSPSRKFIPLGESMPMGLAVGYQGKAGVADNAVLGGMNDLVDAASALAGGARVKEVGEVWAQNIVSGMPSVFKQTDLAQISMPKIPSLLGAADLGAQGLLGPAGSGAFQNKAFIGNNGGNLPNGAGAAGGGDVHVNTNVNIDGEQLRATVQQEIVKFAGALAGAIPSAR